MRIDFHTHAKLTKRTEFDIEHFDAMVCAARESALDGLAITEHFNTVRFHDVYSHFDDSFPVHHGVYRAGDTTLLPGVEVDVSEGVHVLLFGRRGAVFDLHAELRSHLAPESFIPAAALLEAAAELGLIAGLAHPLRPGREAARVDAEVVRRLDFLDLNAKDLYRYGPRMRDGMTRLSHELGLPLLAGSDAHHPLQLGSVATEVPINGDGESALLDAVADAIRVSRCTPIVEPCLPVRVRAAIEIKRALKRYRYGLG